MHGLSSCVFRDNGVPINDSSRKFAVQLIKKVPRQDDGRAAAERLAREKQAEKEKEKQKVDAFHFFRRESWRAPGIMMIRISWV
jgi:hypothetical protein